MREELVAEFKKVFKKKPLVHSSAPGRINIIGEHTDYNKGFVFPMAVQFRTHCLLRPRDDKEVRVMSYNFKDSATFHIDDLKPVNGKKWVKYVQGIFWALVENRHNLRGADILIWGDVPLEAGLSSSASLEISLLTGLLTLWPGNYEPKELARIGQKAENDFVGVNCGLMDQFIAVFGRKDTAVFLDCETLDFEYVPLDLEKENLAFLVYDTRVQRRLAFSEYNQRRLEAQQALNTLGKLGFTSFKELFPERLETLRGNLEPTEFKRARHVVTENNRVLAAKNALKNSEFKTLGQLLFASHFSLRDDYEVSCPELDLFVEIAAQTPGCYGARMVGAGFGGSAIALIKKEAKQTLMAEAEEEAARRNFPRGEMFMVTSGSGAEGGYLF